MKYESTIKWKKLRIYNNTEEFQSYAKLRKPDIKITYYMNPLLKGNAAKKPDQYLSGNTRRALTNMGLMGNFWSDKKSLHCHSAYKAVPIYQTCQLHI